MDRWNGLLLLSRMFCLRNVIHLCSNLGQYQKLNYKAHNYGPVRTRLVQTVTHYHSNRIPWDFSTSLIYTPHEYTLPWMTSFPGCSSVSCGDLDCSLSIFAVVTISRLITTLLRAFQPIHLNFHARLYTLNGYILQSWMKIKRV